MGRPSPRAARSPDAWTAAIILVVSTTAVIAENIVFPAHSAVVNVKTSYGARGDGTTDDSQALQNAVNANQNRLVYLPNGTYLISRELIWGGGSPGVGPWIFGQSRDGVVIRLKDNATGFGDTLNPNSVLRSVNKTPGSGDVSADFFMRTWRNFTLNTGNNRGAIGIRYFSNNSGCLDNVRVIGQGRIGVDLGWLNMNGPCIVSNTEVDGFDVGIQTGYNWNSQTMYNVTVKNARTYGVRVSGQAFFVEKLNVVNAREGFSVSVTGTASLIDASFTGGTGATNAVYCGGVSFVRNVSVSNYAHALYNGFTFIDGASVSEYLSTPVITRFPNSATTSLNLPVKHPPNPAWETDLTKWVIAANGTSAAVQSAVDAAASAGKTTVAIPPGDVTFTGMVNVHGSVRHIIGLGYARLIGGGGGFALASDAAPVVRFENQWAFGGGSRPYRNNNTSTMIIDACDGVSVEASGSGDVFITNTVCHINITNPKAHVWARQCNMEADGGNDAINQGGTLWIMGLKTERNGTKIRTTGGGSTELIGANMYVTTPTDPATPMFEIDDASASFAAVKELCDATCYAMQVRESRGAETMLFNRTENPNVFRYALYAGYVGSGTVAERPARRDAAPTASARLRTAHDRAAVFYDVRGVRIPAWSGAANRRSGRLLVRVTGDARKPACEAVVRF